MDENMGGEIRNLKGFFFFGIKPNWYFNFC